LPELFSGFPRQAGQGPTQYPVACWPQAWAVGSIFMLLQAVLGLTVKAPDRISFYRPCLPDFLREVHLSNLKVGPSILDLLFSRHGSDIGLTVTRREGPAEIVVVK